MGDAYIEIPRFFYSSLQNVHIMQKRSPIGDYYVESQSSHTFCQTGTTMFLSNQPITIRKSTSRIIKEIYESNLSRFHDAFVAYLTPIVYKGEKGRVSAVKINMEAIVRSARDSGLLEAYNLLTGSALPLGVMLPEDEESVVDFVEQTQSQLERFFGDAVQYEKIFYHERKAEKIRTQLEAGDLMEIV